MASGTASVRPAMVFEHRNLYARERFLALVDEARIGQKTGRVRIRARKGTRPRGPADQRYKSACLFGAVRADRETGAALMLPWCHGGGH